MMLGEAVLFFNPVTGVQAIEAAFDATISLAVSPKQIVVSFDAGLMIDKVG